MKTNISLILSLLVLFVSIDSAVASNELPTKDAFAVEQQYDTSDRATLDDDSDFGLINAVSIIPSIKWHTYSLHPLALTCPQRYYSQPIRAPPSHFLSFPLV